MKKEPHPDSHQSRWLRLYLPQHLLLYLALFCSVMGVAFSIQTHLSTDFVELIKPLDAGIFFRNVSSIGLVNWRFCGLQQHVVDEILYGNADTIVYPYAHERALYPNRETVTETSIIVKDELETDDGLKSADFPFRDDDEILAALPSELWGCQTVKIASTRVGDVKWVLSVAFFVIGSILGVTATCFLGVLIILRSRRVNKNVNDAKKRNKYSSEQTKESLRSDLRLRSLDTVSTGYRSIALLFLLAYLFQCAAVIYLDSDICKRHSCHISTGFFSLITACILWVASAVLVFSMMRKVWKNQKLIRAHNEMRRNAIDGDKQNNADASAFSGAGEDIENSSLVKVLNATLESEMSSSSATVDSAEMTNLNDAGLISLSSSSTSIDSIDAINRNTVSG